MPATMFPTDIFQLVVKFETLDQEMLELTKWSKVLPKFAKKSTNNSKVLAQTILSNAAAASAKKATESKVGSPAPSAKSGSSVVDSIAGVKRTRDGETLAQPAAKKVVKPVQQSSKPLALQQLERRKALEKAQAAKAGKDVSTGAPVTTTGNTAKVKVAAVAPPKSAMFSSLLSASKRPGTSNAARAAAAKDPAPPSAAPGLTAVKREAVKKESPPRYLGPTASAATAASSFMGFLADMEKKVDTEPKKEQVVLQETEAERTKRLRKEARRKLRVSWKADGDLVETRLFTHDPDEEQGHADNEMRDAGDTGREGEMLKLHQGLDDLEDDDEDGVMDDMESYAFPSAVDLNDIATDVAANFIKYGGPEKPESPASEAQIKHEENTLMVVFAVGSERPDSPKEPEDDSDDTDFQPTADFGEPIGATRTREKEILSKRPPPSLGAPVGGFDLAAQLRAITSTQAPQQPSLLPASLQQTLSMLGHQNQSTPPPQQVPAAGPDLNKLVAFLQSAQQLTQPQAQAQAQAQAVPQLQPSYQAPPAAATITPNLASLLGSLNAGQAQGQVLPLGSLGNPNPFPGADNGSKKHGRTDSGNEYDENGKKSKKKKSGAGDNNKPYNYKTQICSFWKEGKCIKGDSCTYRHDE